MMYKERGKMFVAIRTKYNSKKGRGDQTKVCSFKSENILNITFEDALIQDQLIAAEVTNNEKQEFKEWFESAKSECYKINNIKMNEKALVCIDTVTNFINEELSDISAQDMYNKIKSLKNKLRELGYKEKRISAVGN